MEFDPVASSNALLRDYQAGKTPLRSVEDALHQTMSSHDIGKDLEEIAHWMDELIGLQELRTPFELKAEEKQLKIHIEKYFASKI